MLRKDQEPKASARSGVRQVFCILSVCSAVAISTLPTQANDVVETVHLFVTPAPTSFSGVGEQISYDYVITNNSSEGISDIVVTDSVLGGPVCEVGLLSPTFSALCTADYFVTEADVAAGVVSGEVSVTSADRVLASASTSVPAAAGDALEITATPEAFGGPGQVIQLDYKVTNTSLQTLTGIEVVDPLVGGSVCSGVSLSPSFMVTCTQNYTTTAADVAAGSITASATAFSDQADPATASKNIPLNVITDSRFKVIPIPESFSGAGQLITLDYRVENDTPFEFQNVVVSDAMVGGQVCEVGLLSPEFTVICTAVYTTTAADDTAGVITGMATAVGEGLPAPETTTYTIPKAE